MARYAALLRGINVGRNKRIAMADLRALLVALGCRDVATLLQSGNALLSSPLSPESLEAQIEAAIQDRFAMAVRCLVRTASELAAVVEANPFHSVATDGSRMMALFLSQVPDPARLALNDPVTLAPSEVALGDRVIYQWCPQGILAAPAVGGFVERYLKVAVTARNWNTVTKLAALVAP